MDKPEHQSTPYPDIVVSPQSLLYGELRTEEEEVQTFNIENIGDAVLSVSDVSVVSGGSSFTILNEHTDMVLEMGESTTIDVRFAPEGTENYGMVIVSSDDPDSPEVPVDLLGYGAVPELVITPEHYNFDDTFVPCGASVELELMNIGNEALTITEMDYLSGGLLALDYGELSLPLTLGPDEAQYVTVDFTAVDIGADTGVLTTVSNDPRGVVTADQNGEGFYANTVTESFTEPGIPPVDVMFLIDQSCSMSDDNIDDIELGIPGFLAELQNVSDWQLVQVTKADGCANGGVMDVDTPNAEQALINNAFNSNHHAYTEALLQLASIALDKTGPGECNDGFLRPGALLHIIVASDEREQSNFSHDHWLNYYANFVADPALVKVSSIVDLNFSCGDGSGPGGYSQAADATGGGKLDICSPSWGAEMDDIAAEVLAGIRTYNLANVPIPSTVEVSVNGVVTNEWDYAVANNSITINDPPVGEGDLVEITYSTAAPCN